MWVEIHRVFLKGFLKNFKKLAVLFALIGLSKGLFRTLRTPYMIQVQNVSTIAATSLPLHSSCLTLRVDSTWEWGMEFG